MESTKPVAKTPKPEPVTVTPVVQTQTFGKLSIDGGNCDDGIKNGNQNCHGTFIRLMERNMWVNLRTPTRMDGEM